MQDRLQEKDRKHSTRNKAANLNFGFIKCLRSGIGTAYENSKRYSTFRRMLDLSKSKITASSTAKRPWRL